MKIGEIAGRQDIEKSPEVSKEIPSSKSVDFRDLLDEELNQTAAYDGKSCTSAGDIDAMSSLAPVIAGDDASAVYGDDMRQMSDAVGSVLDRIADAVSAEDQDLRKLEGVINSLSEEAEGLQEKVGILPESHALRQIADELGVLAYVESVKFKRGDYL